MTGRHEAPPLGSAAREATSPPYVGKRRAGEPATVESVGAMFDDLKRKTDAYWALVDARRAAEEAFATTYDEPPGDPPRCQSCGHLEADECGCTCCTWTCDERPADV